jgi:hypothetical protein
MDAMIIYLKDKPNGKVEVCLEIIGKPDRAKKIGIAIAENMQEIDWAVFNVQNEFNAYPPTDLLQ